MLEIMQKSDVIQGRLIQAREKTIQDNYSCSEFFFFRGSGSAIYQSESVNCRDTLKLH